MHYLLDGYNLAHWLTSDDALRPKELRSALIAELRLHRPKRATSITIYWDVRRGLTPANEDLGWCRMRFVPDADEAIVDAVYDSRNARKLVVVSRDREVTGRSRQLGARTMAPIELLPRR